MSTKKLTGKVAVVTGASKGIGAEIAQALGREGAAVVVNYASALVDAERVDAERVVATIVAAGGRAVAVQADVSKRADVVRLFATASSAFGGLHILVNNAGLYRGAALADITEGMNRHWADLDQRLPMTLAQERIGIKVKVPVEGIDAVFRRDPAAPTDPKHGKRS